MVHLFIPAVAEQSREDDAAFPPARAA